MGCAGFVGLVEVLESPEPGCVDRGLQMRGPGTVGVGVALCRAVGQRSGGDVFELDAQRDLAAGELVGQHRHRSPEHVWSHVAGRDLVQSGPVAGRVDVRGERVEHLVAAGPDGVLAEQGREEPVAVCGQLLGDDHRFGNRGGDPPVLDRKARVVLALGGFDGWCPVVVDDRAGGDFVDYWWSARIPDVRYSLTRAADLVSACDDRTCLRFVATAQRVRLRRAPVRATRCWQGCGLRHRRRRRRLAHRGVRNRPAQRAIRIRSRPGGARGRGRR